MRLSLTCDFEAVSHSPRNQIVKPPQDKWLPFIFWGLASGESLMGIRSNRRLQQTFAERAITMSPDQSQYIWRKTISQIEVVLGSGVFPVLQ